MFLWNKEFQKILCCRLRIYSFLTFLFLCLLVFLLFRGFWAVEKKMRPVILSIAQVRADMLATDAVNRAIIEEVAHGILYQDLISIKQDDSGKIIMAQINTMEINRLMAKTTIATQNALKDIAKEPLKIPLGEVLDSYLLASYGPYIPVRLIPIGRVNTSLLDSFEAAGINQVRHKIYLDVFTEIRIVIPFIAEEIEVHTTVPLADTIYPGEVPEKVINLLMDSLRSPNENVN